MYVTRPLSMYKKLASELSSPPPEGPDTGILVIQDEEPEVIIRCCFGMCKLKDYSVREVPFPQNKELLLRYRVVKREEDNPREYDYYPVLFIPVLNQPLSSNRYYAIQPRGRHKGKAFTSSKEEDVITTCFCHCIHDLDPQPFNPQDIYQQFEIHPRNQGSFDVKSVAQDGFPPNFLRIRGLQVFTSSSRNIQLGEAPGLDANLRACSPEFNFPISYKTSTPVVVGNGNSVTVDVNVPTELVSIAGRELHERNVADQLMWFRSSTDVGGEVTVGLSLAIVERIKLEEVRFGWIGGKEEKVRVNRREEYGGIVGWKKFGCYVLVERFVLKRMDGSLVLTYDFKHTNQIRSKWD
ncbi:hypothetical protein CRYUN_Cryun29cG0085300 [Craigia yunnanensis]